MIERKPINRDEKSGLFRTTLSKSTFEKWKTFNNETIRYELVDFGVLTIPIEVMIDYLEQAKTSERYDYVNRKFNENVFVIEFCLSSMKPNIHMLGGYYKEGFVVKVIRKRVDNHFTITNHFEWSKVLEGYRCQFCEETTPNHSYNFIRTIDIAKFKILYGSRSELKNFEEKDRILVVCPNCKWKIDEGMIKFHPNKYGQGKGGFYLSQPHSVDISIKNNHLDWYPTLTR